MLSPKYSNLKELAESKAAEYQNNQPFPNIGFDDFFDPEFLRKVAAEFPDVSKLKDRIHYANPNEEKFATKGEAQFGEHTKRLVHFLNSATFLQFLQELTGIEELLIPDPYFEGGGFHEIKPGGFLKLHVDFHQHRRMKLSRRLNLLVYLNEDWEEEYGGHFELWERDMSKVVTRILPVFNRVALFTTSGDSWHGHPDPLTCPPDRSRRSLALYYYTNGRPEHELSAADKGRITTTFRGRAGQDNSKMKAYNTLVEVANKYLPAGVIAFLKSMRNK